VPTGVQAQERLAAEKNEKTELECCALILAVKLKRTDTTLDLSHKARVVKKQSLRTRPPYIVLGGAYGLGTDHGAVTRRRRACALIL
jgi:hypothetical protein